MIESYGERISAEDINQYFLIDTIIYNHYKTLLCLAIQNASYDICKSLLNLETINPNEGSKSAYKYKFNHKAPINYAILRGDIDILKLILRHPKIDWSLIMNWDQDDREPPNFYRIALHANQNQDKIFELLLAGPEALRSENCAEDDCVANTDPNPSFGRTSAGFVGISYPDYLSSNASNTMGTARAEDECNRTTSHSHQPPGCK